MDTFEFDSVLISPIIEILDLGTEKLLTPLLILASLFAAIDGLYGYFQYQTAKEPSAVMPKVIGKWIRYALTFGIMKIYIKTIIPMAYQIFTGIGNSFGEGFGNPLKIQSIWNIGWQEVNKLLKLTGDMDGIWIFVYIVFTIIAFLCLILMMSTITMVILSFHVVVRLAVIFLAFVPLETFSDIGKKVLTSIINSGTDLMVCVALSSMCLAIIKKHPFPDNVTVENNSPQVMGIWLCVWLVSTFMVMFYEKISSMIISGQGGLTGAEFGKYTAGVVTTAGVVVGTAVGVIGGVAGGMVKAAGETWSKFQSASKGAEMLKKSGKTINNVGGKMGRGLTKTARGTAKTIEMMTGNFEPQRTLASMIQNYTPGVKEKEEEEKNKNTEEKENPREEARETNSKGKYTKEKGETSNTDKNEQAEADRKQNENTTNNKNNKGKTKTGEGSSSTSNKTADTNKTSNTMNNKEQKSSKNEMGSSTNTNSTSTSQEKNSYSSSSKTMENSSSQNNVKSEGTSSTANKTADTNSTENIMNSSLFSNSNDTEVKDFDTYTDIHSFSNTETQETTGTAERVRKNKTTTFADEERIREQKKKNED